MELIFSIIGTITGLVAIILFCYDIILKQRKIAKRVQNFYENFENLIFYNYEHIYYSIDNPQKLSSCAELYIISKLRVEREFEENAKYLGISRVEKKIGQEKKLFYVNYKGHSVKKDGTVEEKWESFKINDNLILKIQEYLDMLRKYWNENYSKRLLKPKINKSLDFFTLSGYQNPKTYIH